MNKLGFLFSIILSVNVFASGGGFKKLTYHCYLDIREERNHIDGPFEGYGVDEAAAREETLDNCKSTLEAHEPGLCESYRHIESAWGCERKVIYRR
jgi:hypothetical protein